MVNIMLSAGKPALGVDRSDKEMLDLLIAPARAAKPRSQWLHAVEAACINGDTAIIRL